MNTTERTQAAALHRFVRFGPNHLSQQFARNLYWLLKHEPDTVLTRLQKYKLQMMCYRYRRQLAGRVHDDLIPASEPKIEDYVKSETCQQQDLLL